MGAIEALSAHGSPALKDRYLARMISGEWTGTMNLTEPHAGSDVGALTSRAERHEDGSYRIFGQKIYITWGDHDAADNIIHLVLGRLPDAPRARGAYRCSWCRSSSSRRTGRSVPATISSATRSSTSSASMAHRPVP